MKRRTYILISFLSTLFVIFANNTTIAQTQYESQKKSGEIIYFEANKCVCCWGWVIKIGNDTIKTRHLPNPEIKPGIINTPIKVIIELGSKMTSCKNYYYVKYCELIKE